MSRYLFFTQQKHIRLMKVATKKTTMRPVTTNGDRLSRGDKRTRQQMYSYRFYRLITGKRWHEGTDPQALQLESRSVSPEVPLLLRWTQLSAEPEILRSSPATSVQALSHSVSLRRTGVYSETRFPSETSGFILRSKFVLLKYSFFY